MRYLFEDCTLDTDRRELRRGGHVRPVAAQVFDLLEYLIRNRARVVSKDDLVGAIWDGRIVSEAAITTRLNVARRAIGDNGHDQRLIKTLPRKGFLFAASVREEKGDVTATARPLEPPSAATEKASVAVLPFTNMNGDADQDYFADGITADIITELSRFSELLVIARNSSFQYKGKTIDAQQIGRELAVGYLLEGSIRRDGDRVRIVAQLIDTTRGVHRWSERYDRKILDVFAVQDEVARGIATMLAAHVNKAEVERALLKPPTTWQAHDYFLQASDIDALLRSSLKKEDLYETRRLLEHALAIDPKYARAYAMLSGTHVLAWANRFDDDYRQPATLHRAHRLAREAVRLDPNLPQARCSLGNALVWMRQHEAAIEEFERAIALNPNFADWRFAWALVYGGEPARAIEVCNAHMRLDPFHNALAPSCLGLAHYLRRRYSNALPLLRESISRSPDNRAAHAFAAATYAQLGALEEARAAADEVIRIEPSYTIEWAKRHSIFKYPGDADHYFDGIRKAGLPER